MKVPTTSYRTTVPISCPGTDEETGLLSSTHLTDDPERTLKYDKLVVAVGAEPASGIEKVPGAKEHAIPFYSIEDSYRVKQAIRELKVTQPTDATSVLMLSV